MTQKLHEKLQPSCTFTNARTRSSRAAAWTQPIAPTSPATKSAVSSLSSGTTTTFCGRPANASFRLAPQPVTYTRPPLRAAWRAALRDFRTASLVTQQVLRTATSGVSVVSECPSASRRSRISCASAWETLQPRKLTENVAIVGHVRDARRDRRPSLPCSAARDEPSHRDRAPPPRGSPRRPGGGAARQAGAPPPPGGRGWGGGAGARGTAP